MSSTLVYRLLVNNQKFGDELKRILQKKYPDILEQEICFNSNHLDYLKGLYDGGIKDAGFLINIINEHEFVYLSLQY